MPPPLRILRARAEAFTRPRESWRERDHQRHNTILDATEALMSEFGRHSVTFATLAIALSMSQGLLRRHFADLDALFDEILQRHLLELSQVTLAIPNDATSAMPRRRAAYLAATRTEAGGFTPAHLLFVRDRQLLPFDLLEAIEDTRAGLGELLAGDLATEALALLDAPYLDPDRIEARLRPAAPPTSKPNPTWPREPRGPARGMLDDSPSAPPLEPFLRKEPSTAPP